MVVAVVVAVGVPAEAVPANGKMAVGMEVPVLPERLLLLIRILPEVMEVQLGRRELQVEFMEGLGDQRLLGMEEAVVAEEAAVFWIIVRKLWRME